MNLIGTTAVENWQWKKTKAHLKPSFPPKSVSSSQKTWSDFAKPPKSEVTNRLKPVKRRARSCCERLKVRAVVTGAAGVEEFVPKEGKAKEEGWSESNMAAKLNCYL